MEWQMTCMTAQTRGHMINSPHLESSSITNFHPLEMIQKMSISLDHLPPFPFSHILFGYSYSVESLIFDLDQTVRNGFPRSRTATSAEA